MKKIHLMLVILLFCFMMTLFGDIVTLKNGREFQGVIISQSGAFIVVKDDYGIEYKLPKADVSSIKVENAPGPVPQTPTTPTTPVTKHNETEDNNRFSKANPLAFDSTGIAKINAKIFPKGDRDYFLVKVEKAGEYSFTATSSNPVSRLGIRIMNSQNNLVKNWIWAEEGKNSVLTSIDINYDYIGQFLIFEVAQYGDSKLIDYTIDVACHEVPDIFEINGRFKDSKEITLNSKTDAYIFPNGDRDYYKLMIPGQGRLTFKLSCPDQNIRLGLRLMSEENNLLRNWVHAKDIGEQCELIQDFNEPTLIYLEVSNYGDNRRSFTPYTINNTFEVIPDKFEPNGRFKDAATIPVGADAEAYIFSTGDRDYFRFTVDRTGLITFKLSTQDPVTRLGFRVLTDENHLFNNWVVAAENAQQVELQREMFAGDYLIEVNEYGDNYASMKPYSVNIKLSPSPDPFEPNNSFSQATAIKLNTPVSATIFPKGDRDYYKVDITRTSELRIDIKSDAVSRMGVRILNADNGLYQNWNYATDFGKDLYVKKEIKDPGTYYVEVMNYGDARGTINPYSLTLSLK